MNTKLKKFLKNVCLSNDLSQISKEDRTYAVLMYLIETGEMTYDEAEEIMDTVKSGESI